MTERINLLQSIANTIQDYRANEIDRPTPEHIDRWVKQFDEAVQENLLRELDYVLQQTYFNKNTVTQFLNTVITSEKLAGSEPCNFWQDIKFLNIQQGGNSQRELLSMINSILSQQYGLSVSNCGTNNPQVFLYLDDVLFSGNRIKNDINQWIENDAPTKAKLHIVTIAFHRSGKYYAETKINETARKYQKNIELSWWKCADIEDLKNSTKSDVLRPTYLPDDHLVNQYVSSCMTKYPPIFRSYENVGEHDFFSSNAGRVLLEQEMLKAGVRIRNMCPHFYPSHRPLGYTLLETLGFGSMLVTFRNCPNNAPLALWAGSPWYPLFPRRNN